MRLAERGGFEPPEGCPSSVFKTDALNRSTISPLRRILPGDTIKDTRKKGKIKAEAEKSAQARKKT